MTDKAKKLLMLYEQSGKHKTLKSVPPLTFKGYGKDLKNYRIYGNTVGGESVGDLVTSGEHAGEYKVPVTVEGKNLLPNPPLGTRTVNGVTFTVNTDGSITCSGTASSTAFFSWMNAGLLPNNEWVRLTGCPSGGGSSNYLLKMQIVGSSDSLIMDTGSGSIVLFSQPIYPVIRIGGGYTCNNLTFYPMLRLASITDGAYETYRTPIATPIYLPEQIKKVGDEAEYVDYKEQKQHRVRKNLLQNTATSQTINGVTFTVNNDGSVTCNGTSGAMIQYNINTASLFNITENVILSGCPSSGSSSTFLFRGVYPFDYTHSNDDGNGVLINRIGEQIRAQIRIASGYTCNNLTFFPMIRRAEIEDDTYEPYIENTEVDVTLPEIAVTAGTNILSVGTTVQPSKVEITGKIKQI